MSTSSSAHQSHLRLLPRAFELFFHRIREKKNNCFYIPNYSPVLKWEGSFRGAAYRCQPGLGLRTWHCPTPSQAMCSEAGHMTQPLEPQSPSREKEHRYMAYTKDSDSSALTLGVFVEQLLGRGSQENWTDVQVRENMSSHRESLSSSRLV